MQWNKRVPCGWQSQRRALQSGPLRTVRQLGGVRLPWVFRLLPTADRGAGGEGPLARDHHLAVIEAALLAAEEPLPTRKLAEIAGLKDAGEARRLVKRLQGLYQQEESALHIMELAGGFQLLTRP